MPRSRAAGRACPQLLQAALITAILSGCGAPAGSAHAPVRSVAVTTGSARRPPLTHGDWEVHFERFLGDPSFTRIDTEDAWDFSPDPGVLVEALPDGGLAVVDAATGKVRALLPAPNDQSPAVETGQAVRPASLRLRQQIQSTAYGVVAKRAEAVVLWTPGERGMLDAKPRELSLPKNARWLAASPHMLEGIVWLDRSPKAELGPRRIDLQDGSVQCDFPLPNWWSNRPGGDESDTVVSEDGQVLVMSDRAGYGVWAMGSCQLIASVRFQEGSHLLPFAIDSKQHQVMEFSLPQGQISLYGWNGRRESRQVMPGAKMGAISRDGRFAAAVRDGMIELVSVTARPTIRQVEPLGPGDPVQALRFSPDGQRLLVVGNRRVNVVSTETGQVTWVDGKGDLPSRIGRRMAFSGHGLLAVGEGGFVRIYDVSRGQLVQAIPLGASDSLDFSVDGTALVGLGEESAWRWDVKRRSLVWERAASGVKVLPYGNALALWDESSKTLRVIDGATGKLKKDSRSDKCSSAPVSLSMHEVVCESKSEGLIVHDMVDASKDRPFPLPSLLLAATVDIRMPNAVVRNTSGGLVLLSALNLDHSLELGGGDVAALSSDGRFVAWAQAGMGGGLFLQDVEGKRRWSGPIGVPIHALAFDPSGASLAVSRSTHVEIWSIAKAMEKAR